MNFSNLFITISIIIFAAACRPKQQHTNKISDYNIDKQLDQRYNQLLSFSLDSNNIPRSYTKSNSSTRGVASDDWTSGFFPGNLWQLYRITKQEKYMKRAQEWTNFIEKEKYNNNDHDMGFRIYPCFGIGYEITGNKYYKDVLIESAKTLCSRYSSVVGAIKSWDFNAHKWEYPVIIDNMINLELLFKATEITRDSSYYNIAVNHANKTLQNHFRKDNSVIHVIDFNRTTGKMRQPDTHQGLNVNSSWARGQAWAIYGYTMTYRFTKDKKYLDQAIATAAYFLEHKNLPENGIAYWDFADPKIPDTHIDVTASAVVCSALFELYQFTNNRYHLDNAQKILSALLSEKYIIKNSIKAPFILDYSTGNKPKEDELDEPIVYGDYYFLEALYRSKNI